MDRGAWWATVPTVAKSQTRLKQFSTNLYISDQLILNKSTKAIQQKKKQSYQQMVWGQWDVHIQITRLDPFLLYIQINSK